MPKKPLECRICGNARYKTVKRIDGHPVTRCCDQIVTQVNGVLYASLEDAPEWQILQAYAANVRALPQLEHYAIDYGDLEYQTYLRAARSLLGRCGWDLALAIETITQSFHNRKFSWKWNNSNASFWKLLGRDLPAIKACAQHHITRRANEQEIQRQRASSGVELAYADVL
jgi:hypothetical protein